jgi:hypothetical protein
VKDLVTALVTCKTVGCHGEPYAREYCRRCYAQWRRTGATKPPRKPSRPGRQIGAVVKTSVVWAFKRKVKQEGISFAAALERAMEMWVQT